MFDRNKVESRSTKPSATWSFARYARELFSLISPHWQHFSLAMTALAAGSAINLAFPELVRRVVNAGWPSLSAVNLLLLGAGFGLLFLFQSVCIYVRSYYFNVVGLRVVANLRKKLFQATLARDVAFFEETRSADLVSRLGSDTLQLQDAVSLRLSVVLRYTVQAIAGVVAMFWLSWRLSAITLVILPVIMIVSRNLGKKLRQKSKEQQAALAASQGIADEAFSQIRVVKAFENEKSQLGRYREGVSQIEQIGIARSNIGAFFQAFASWLINMALVGVLLYGIFLAAENKMPGGDLAAFTLYGFVVAVSFAFLINGYVELIQSLGAAERVFELLEHVAPSHESKATTTPPHTASSLHFKNVSFRYPSRPEVWALQDASFEIPAGVTTALLGASGAGKTSVVSLILRFYQQESGEISLGQQSIAACSLSEYRKLISYVPQEAVLFNVTIAENLRVGDETASTEDLIQACESANIWTFIQGLPQGLETLVGDRGGSLSGGQRQRLALARAFLRNPKILILDEATSALDSESEILVQQALSRLMANRTCIVIAHRMATVKTASHVIVLEKGKVIQEGPPSQLLGEEGFYRRVVELQQLEPVSSQ